MRDQTGWPDEGAPVISLINWAWPSQEREGRRRSIITPPVPQQKDIECIRAKLCKKYQREINENLSEEDVGHSFFLEAEPL